MPLIDRQALQTHFGERVRFDEPLSRHTSFRIGGPADAWIEVHTPEDIRVIQLLARETGLPVFVLGGGTNLLVSDRGVRGIVLHLGRPLGEIQWQPNGVGWHVQAGAAVPFKRLVTETIHRALTGLEFAEGIPGSLGGGLLMNAGAFGGEISNVVEWIDGVDASGEIRRVPRSELKFSYRHFDIEPGFVVTAMQFLLQTSEPDAVVARRDDAKRRRASKQPLGYPNAGSVFKNPAGHFAGRLIESSGLKGRQIGGAMISPEHGNFIVNVGNARAADVRALMQVATETVWQQHQVRLEPEIKLVGDWSE